MSRLYEREETVAIQAVCEAARLCRAVASQISPEVLAKKDKSPVTVADFGSQALICRALTEAFPDDPVIAEEDAAELKSRDNAGILEQVLAHVRAARTDTSGEAANMIDADQICRWIDHGGGGQYSERFWTLDPIDGTKGFLRGEQYAVALALIVEGRIVVAALACPNLPVQPATGKADRENVGGAVFHAVSGQGAFVVPAESHGAAQPAPCASAPVAVTSRPLRVSASRSSQGIAHRATRRLSPLAWGSWPRRCGWTARRNTRSSPAAMPTFICGCPREPTIERRSGTTLRVP